MRLARIKGPPQGTRLMVAEVSPPYGSVAPTEDHVESFGAEWRRMHPPLISYAERFFGKEDAADLVGDVMESIWCRWPMLVRERPGDGYYFRAVQYAINAKREANKQFVSLDDAEEELDQMAFEAAPRPSRGDTKSDLIRAAIAALPPKRRAVVLLLKEQDITYAQAAELLGVSVGTINSHVYQANADIRAAVLRAGHRAGNEIAQRPTLRLTDRSPQGGDSND